MAEVDHTPKKVRKINEKVAESSLENILVGTQAKDMDFIKNKLLCKPQLIPFVASWMRDGVIDKAMDRQTNKEANMWPASSKCVRNLGITNCRNIVSKVADQFEQEKLDEDEIFIACAGWLRHIQFGANCKDTTWLPMSSVDSSCTFISDEIRHLGRLKNAPVACDWQDFGYFTLDALDPTLVTCLVCDGWFVKLNFSLEAMALFDDWKIGDNWLTSATLHSKKAGEKSILRNLFVLKYGADEVDIKLPRERLSFEPDRKSIPAFLKRCCDEGQSWQH